MTNHSTQPEAIHAALLQVAGLVSHDLWEALRQVGRMEWPRSNASSLVEFMMRAIVGQQLSTKVARVIWQRLCDAAEGAGENIEAFVLHTEAAQLRSFGVSLAKIRAMKATIAAELEGELQEDELARMSHGQRAACLRRIWGVGEWTANIVSMFYYCDADVWPSGDSAATGTLRKLTFAGGSTLPATAPAPALVSAGGDEASFGGQEGAPDLRSEQDIAAIAARFAPYRSYLALAMWRYLDGVPAQQ